jgi:hypothetical protein
MVEAQIDAAVSRLRGHVRRGIVGTTARARTGPSTRIVLVLCFLQGKQQLAAATHGAIAYPLRHVLKRRSPRWLMLALHPQACCA